jgi:dipeptidyl-peptidase-4
VTEPAHNGYRIDTNDGNLILFAPNAPDGTRLTSDGALDHIEYGNVPALYEGEFGLDRGVWWSPSNTYIAFYRTDLSGLRHASTFVNLMFWMDSVETRPVSMAGEANPSVSVGILDVASRTWHLLDLRAGRSPSDPALGHYLLVAGWSPSGNALLIWRMERRQTAADLVACAPQVARCRTIFHDENAGGWVDLDHPYWLQDGRHLMLISDRDGFRNIYIVDSQTGITRQLTRLTHDIEAITGVDEVAGTVYYLAYDGETRLYRQLHAVDIAGHTDRVLTSPDHRHTAYLSPDKRYFVDVAQSPHSPMSLDVVSLPDAKRRVSVPITTRDWSRAGLRPVDIFPFQAADGTRLYGRINYPAHFDSTKRYPVLLHTYAAPGTQSAVTGEFSLSSPLCDYGLILVELETRGSSFLGRGARNATYRRMGEADGDDIARGMEVILSRRFTDSTRVGVFGMSHGGYSAISLLERSPQLFRAAAASSPVSDWRYYYSIYSERFLDLPSLRPDAYAQASLLDKASRIHGKVLLYYGTADDNVSPTHSLALLNALDGAGVPTDVQIGVDAGHSAVSPSRLVEFFERALQGLGGR